MDDRRRASAIRRRWQIGEALDLALDRGPRDDYRRPDVRSLRRLAALIEEDRGYFGHRHCLKSYIHAGRNDLCCPRNSSLMRRRITAGEDRTSVERGKRVSTRVERGGGH